MTTKVLAKAPKGILKTKQKTVPVETTKAPDPKPPKIEEVQDLEWMNWVEYAQSRIRYLENQVAEYKNKVEELKANNKRLNDRIMAG